MGAFVRRENRFLVTVECEGRLIKAHLPNSGRLEEVLVPGYRAFLVRKDGGHRKTEYDLTLMEAGRVLVSVDARLPPLLFEESLVRGDMPPFAGYEVTRKEVPWGEGRLDLLLHGPGGPCLVETKSVTLVREEVALFPDGLTERGRRHLETLAQAVKMGTRSAIVFVVQRPDVVALSPNDAADPAFARALREAVKGGVEAYACLCRVTLEEILIERLIPVRL